MSVPNCEGCTKGKKVWRENFVMLFGSALMFSIPSVACWILETTNAPLSFGSAKWILSILSLLLWLGTTFSLTAPRLFYWRDGNGHTHEHITLPRNERVVSSGGTLEREQFFDDQGRVIEGPILGIHPTIRRRVQVFNGNSESGRYGFWYIRSGRNGMLALLDEAIENDSTIMLKLHARDAIPLMTLRMRMSQMIYQLHQQEDAEEGFCKLSLSMMSVAAWLDHSSNRTQSKIGEHCRLMLEEGMLAIPFELRLKWKQLVPDHLRRLELATLGKHRNERNGPKAS